jgi:hypothetical protein
MLSRSSGPLTIAFEVEFEGERITVYAPTTPTGAVSAASLERCLAVKLRGRIAPDATGFFVVTNEEGFEKELSGEDDVSDYATILFELGLTKKERKARQAAKKDADTQLKIKEKLQQRRFQSVLRIKKEASATSPRGLLPDWKQK